MIICIPIEKNLEGESRVHGHFGSAPTFLLHNTEKGSYEALENVNPHDSHGHCNPMGTLTGHNVEAVVCHGMGRRAVERLNQVGVKVLVGEAVTAKEAIEAFTTGNLRVLSPDEACCGHGHHESGPHGHQGHGGGCHGDEK